MRGLPFPQGVDRETSYEYGTPAASTGPDDIPIDPALADLPIDPALQTPQQSHTCQELPSTPTAEYHHQSTHHRPEYSQAPQGDPFAPIPVYYPPPEDTQPVQPSPIKKAPKRKRKKVFREDECGFCQGNDDRNRDGQPERMVTCDECGRSGHPRCMQLDSAAELMYSYPWKCAECKPCEVCNDKEDDGRMLCCDSCDRGWHMDCLNPPLAEAPPGAWHCPACPQFHLDQEMQPPMFSKPEPEVQEVLGMVRESSPASSSRSHPPRGRPKSMRKKGKGRTAIEPHSVAADDSEMEVDMNIDVETVEQPVHQTKHDDEEVSDATPKASRRRQRKRPSLSPRKSRRASRIIQDSSPPPARASSSPKRPVLKITPPQHPSIPQRRVVLRVPQPASASTKGKEKEVESSDEEPGKGLFDDLLTVQERDISKTTITVRDKSRFDRSRQLAEDKLAVRPKLSFPEFSTTPDTPIAGPSSRPLRSTIAASIHTPITPATLRSESPTSTPAPSTPAPHSLATKPPLRIRTIRFGIYDIQTWYDAPFPEEYNNIPDGRLWLCEYCLKYMKSQFMAARHRMKCKARHPPGDEIYRDGAVSMFEVDGRLNKIYCQNLCLLSKMFLDHKSLFYDVEPFLFYVMTEVDEFGAHFIGYFSKEKRSPKDYNVSCIMTLPVRQRKGWGNLLIEFSYLLSKKEQRTGSPEKPLSGLGALGYKNYWTLSLMRYLHTAPAHPRLEDISAATCMTLEDIYNTLSDLKFISVRSHFPAPKPLPGQSIKFPKGRKSGVARRHLVRSQTSQSNGGGNGAEPAPFVPPASYEIRWSRDEVWQWLERWEQKGHLRIRPERLKWSPFLLARVKKTDGVEGRSLEEGGLGGGGLGVGIGVGFGTPATATEGEASTSAMTLDHHQPEEETVSVGERNERSAQSGEEVAEEEDHEVRPVRGRKRNTSSRSPAKTRRLTRAPSNKSLRSSGRLANGSATKTPIRRLRSQRGDNTPSPLSLTPSGRANIISPRKNAAVSVRRTSTRGTRTPRKSTTRSPRKSAAARPVRRRRRKVDSDAEYSEEEEEEEDASEASEESEELPEPPDSDDDEDDNTEEDAESEEELPVPTQRRRRVSGRASVKDAGIVDDAAFAARLAAQEGPRLLRSRSATGTGSGPTSEPILKRSVSAVSATSRIMGRKRRRIESSPEPEGSPEIEAGPDEGSQQPLPSRTTEDANTPPLPTGSPSISFPPPLALPQDTDHVMEDAKSEFDSGTPFTATAHSRQSAPSDDTVIGNGDGSHANGMGNGKGMDVVNMDVDSAVASPTQMPLLNGHGHQQGQTEMVVDAKTEFNPAQPQGLNGTQLAGLQFQYEEGSDADAEGEPDDEL